MSSKNIFVACSLFMLYASLIFYPRWKQEKNNAVLTWDVSGYYWYLPSIFIYHDIKQQGFKDHILTQYQPTSGVNDFQQAFRHESGNYVMKYSMGMSVMYSPFFLLAHELAGPLGYPADGFSLPYQFAIQLGGLLVAILGLWYLRKFLLKFYSDKVVSICLLLLVVGTNFLNYGAIDTGMSHCWLFTIYVFILHVTYRFYEKPSFKNAVALGLLCGLATLTRPTDIISVLIPLLWGLKKMTFSAIRNHIRFLIFNLRYLLVSVAFGFLVLSVQLAYWKYASGEWIVYSYQDQGFTWLHPHFIKYLFGAHNGWLAYAPIMMFSFIGLIPFLKKGQGNIAVLVFLLLDVYLVSCWEFYYYGGRFMVQAYPILLLPMASFVTWVLEKNIRLAIALPILLLFVYVGLWTNIQYHYGDLYDWDTSNKKYYLATIGRWHVPEDVFKLKDTDELFEGRVGKMTLLYATDFEQNQNAIQKDSTNRSLMLDASTHSREISIPYYQSKTGWLRASAKFNCVLKEWNVWNMTQFIVSFRSKGKDIKTKMIRVHRFLTDGAERDIFIDTEFPKESIDEIKIGFWNNDSQQTIFIDDLKVWILGDHI